MALRGGNQTVAPHSPFLKTADADPVARASRPGICAGESPVILDLIAPRQQVIHDHREVRKCVMNDCVTSSTAFRPTAGGLSFTRSAASSEKNAATLAGFWLHHASV